ncbi:MAG: hypothetical protein ACRETN_13355 [Nevskiales bacterium]
MRRNANLSILGGALLLAGHAAPASELALQGYAGYALVDTDAGSLECVSRACPGVLDDTLFYGLSLGFQEGIVGGQLILSQDVDEDPRVSLAQLSLSHTGESMQVSGRAGRIIVPLGLYGSTRITPNTRPGLVLPQSFLLNSFYDLLTLSEEGVAVELRSGGWSFKAAAYEPDKETVETVLLPPGGLLPIAGPNGNVLGNLVDAVLFLLFGPADAPPVPGQPGSQVVTSKRTSRGYYGGLAYENNGLRTDFGYTDLNLLGVDFRSLNAGVEYAFGAWQPSLELFEFDVDNGDEVRGGSATLVYNGDSWQLFANAVRLGTDETEARETVFGGAYYWNNWAAKLARHDIDSDLPQVSAEDSLRSTVLSLAYSFN